MKNIEQLKEQILIAGYELKNINRELKNSNLLAIICKINEIQELFNLHDKEQFENCPIRKQHYANLNADKKEVFKPWEITEAIYWHFLEMLPPLKYTANGFLLSEFWSGSITTHYYKIGDSYYCEFYDIAQKKTA